MTKYIIGKKYALIVRTDEGFRTGIAECIEINLNNDTILFLLKGPGVPAYYHLLLGDTEVLEEEVQFASSSIAKSQSAFEVLED